TQEIRERKVGPLDEVENTLFFFEHTIFETVAQFYAAFDAKLATCFPEVRRRRPFLTFASWVGGDRDGNPFVTPEVSRATAAPHRAHLLADYDRQCEKLIEELSPSAPRARAAGRDPFQPSEVYRRQLLVMRGRLKDGYLTPAEFVRDLEQIQGG